jgi:hypothetical protein
MTTEIYNGGPANPIGNEIGISIRDYFATAIMTGVYSAGAQATITAADAYSAADAMLAVRLQTMLVVEPVVTPVVEPVVETPVEETVADPTV